MRERFNNVTFYTGNSADLLPTVLNANGLGFVLIDGDHSEDVVRNDINCLLRMVPKQPVAILLHDSANPECRAGILSADWERCPYVHYLELDFVIGELMPDGELWGGMAYAILLPTPRATILNVQQSGAEQLLCYNCAHRRAHRLPVISSSPQLFSPQIVVAFRAMPLIILSPMMPMAIQSCPHVSTADQSFLCRKPRRKVSKSLCVADGAVAAKGRSHLAFGNIARGVRHSAV
jgi:hypothetical protein